MHRPSPFKRRNHLFQPLLTNPREGVRIASHYSPNRHHGARLSQVDSVLSWEAQLYKAYDEKREPQSLQSRAQLTKAMFAVQLLEGAYKGPDSLTYFAELSDMGQARRLEVGALNLPRGALNISWGALNIPWGAGVSTKESPHTYGHVTVPARFAITVNYLYVAQVVKQIGQARINKPAHGVMWSELDGSLI
eukprot:7668867-Pyramimonas_sp.AAC.2